MYFLCSLIFSFSCRLSSFFTNWIWRQKNVFGKGQSIFIISLPSFKMNILEVNCMWRVWENVQHWFSFKSNTHDGGVVGDNIEKFNFPSHSIHPSTASLFNSNGFVMFRWIRNFSPSWSIYVVNNWIQETFRTEFLIQILLLFHAIKFIFLWVKVVNFSYNWSSLIFTIKVEFLIITDVSLMKSQSYRELRFLSNVWITKLIWCSFIVC